MRARLPSCYTKRWGPWSKRQINALDARWRPVLAGPEEWLDFAYTNTTYSVQFSEYTTSRGVYLHLWIRRHKGGAKSVPWSSKQKIKTQLVGPERVAVEVFPAESELVDSANMYHLWVYPEDEILPFRLR